VAAVGAKVFDFALELFADGRFPVLASFLPKQLDELSQFWSVGVYFLVLVIDKSIGDEDNCGLEFAKKRAIMVPSKGLTQQSADSFETIGLLELKEQRVDFDLFLFRVDIAQLHHVLFVHRRLALQTLDFGHELDHESLQVGLFLQFFEDLQIFVGKGSDVMCAEAGDQELERYDFAFAGVVVDG
jgi:hypothetical protein